ncbi:hypothetical protein BYT27DRAFT_7215922 [Phlegmacium glaucopus]|nr:hypothetical protein BYT27DRAFT_7215922 [Phlegmacium glaucopus]
MRNHHQASSVNWPMTLVSHSSTSTYQAEGCRRTSSWNHLRSVSASKLREDSEDVYSVTAIPDNLEISAAASILCAPSWVVLPGAGAIFYIARRVIVIDAGEGKRMVLCVSGHNQVEDTVADIKKATDGRGAHAAIVITTSMADFLSLLRWHSIDISCVGKKIPLSRWNSPIMVPSNAITG